MKRKFLYCGSVFLFCLTVSLVTGCSKNEEVKIKPPEVVIAKIRSQNLAESIDVVGGVVAKDRVFLRARITGFLEKRNFKEGAFVKKGDLLFQIEKTEYQAEVETAKAQLQTAEANLKNTIIDYNRQKYLVDKDAVSKKNYDLAVCAKAKAEAGVLGGKAALKEARLELSYTDIYAPFSGKTGKSRYSVGNLVGPNSDSLALLTMIDPISVEFNISESLFISLRQYEDSESKKSQKRNRDKLDVDFVTVKLILANGTEYPISGKINFVDNVINPMTGTILVRAEFKNPDALLTPGAYVNVIIETNHKLPRLLVPQAAVQEDQTGQFVMMLNKKNEVIKKNIKTAAIHGKDVVVLKGLELGDRVIQEGLQMVRGGMIVTPIEVSSQSQNTVTSLSNAKEKAKVKNDGNSTNKDKNIKVVKK
jgi:membrane fusion protein, multidrug efflux system